jgi:1,2-diacylglycerol 3-alpha-glucosyltransferase
MILQLAMAFVKQGHDVTLVAAKEYEPTTPSRLPLRIIYLPSALTWLFKPSLLPFHPQLMRFLRKHKHHFDWIISSELFSLNSLLAACMAPDKTIVWNEQGKHNRKYFRLPSWIWYNIVARLLMRNVKVVARSPIASRFVRRFGMKVSSVIIDHGIDRQLFHPQHEKEPFFMVSARLDADKNVISLLMKYKQYAESYPDRPCRFYIAGSDGGELPRLKQYVCDNRLDGQIRFLGRISSSEMASCLRRSICLLCDSKKESNMISINEAIVSGTPVITNTVPFGHEQIRQYQLGIAKENWTAEDMYEVVTNNAFYVENCLRYAPQLYLSKVPDKFMQAFHEDTPRQ